MLPLNMAVAPTDAMNQKQRQMALQVLARQRLNQSLKIDEDGPDGCCEIVRREKIGIGTKM